MEGGEELLTGGALAPDVRAGADIGVNFGGGHVAGEGRDAAGRWRCGRTVLFVFLGGDRGPDVFVFGHDGRNTAVGQSS